MTAEERREMVLEAAVAEFALHGLAGTSTECLAEVWLALRTTAAVPDGVNRPARL